MQKSDTAHAAYATTVAANDLGPLAWVLDELRKSLDSATKALRKYVRDAEQARGSDLASVDSGPLRISRQQMHQAVGALDMVGFDGPATLLRAMENAVQKFVNRPELCTEAAAIKIERASFALTGFLETVLAGKPQTPVALFVQYAEVQEIAGAARVHPADLWPYPWRWVSVADTGVVIRALDRDTRALFDKSALQVIKALDHGAAQDLAQLSAGIASQLGNTDADRQFTAFWRIAAGFFQAIGSGSLAGDVYVKRTVSRILIQLAAHTKGDMSVSERLAQDLLFFCAQSQPQGMAALLGEVRMAYGLASYPPINYSKSLYGQFDPVLLVQARKRISTAKESWSALAAGDMGKVKTVQDQFSLIVDSISKLLPTGQSLSKALMDVAETAAKTAKPPEPALGMEVATSILYLEAGFEDFDPADATLTDRVNHLAQRVENARQGAQNQALERWMEELYRRVSDRQTMGSVVGELKTSLAELEKSMDQFFRHPQDKTVLSSVPSRLSQMRGVLSVLGLDHASQAVLRMRDSIEQILVTEVDDAQARATGTFDKLGNNLGALSFLIDMLSYQPMLAKKLFMFDDERGELKPLMGRVNTPIPTTERALDAPVMAATAMAAVSSVTTTAAVVASKIASVQVAPVEDSFGDDIELLDIFLEEAREVVGNGQAALGILATQPENLAELTTLRRAFHTLKGSSRMVGLNTFGEAGWSLEQMLNAWLAEQKPADDDLRKTAYEALKGMGLWVDAIAAGQSQSWSAEPFRASADSMRLNSQYLPLALSLSSMPAQVSAAKAVDDIAQAAPATAVDNLALDASGIAPDKVSASLEPALQILASPTVDPLFDLSVATTDTPVPASPGAGQSLQDLDFVFDLAMSDFEANASAQPLEVEPIGTASEVHALENVALKDLLVDAAVPARLADNTITVDDDLSGLDFDFDLIENSAMPLGASEDKPIVATDLILPDAVLDDVSNLTDQSASQGDDPIDLVNEDEMAAFERAMHEQDVLMAAQKSRMQTDISFDAPTQVTDIGQSKLLPQSSMSMMLSSESIPDSVSADLGNFGIAATRATAAAAFTSVSGSPVSIVSTPTSGQSVASDFAVFSTDDQYKAIGPLRISLPLYNVYLGEADEWSRGLITSLAEWALEPAQQLPNDAIVFAHSLAGSSATVGFRAMSGLARSLEHALQHVQNISEDGSYDSHQLRAEFTNAAEEIRHLLTQFAAGQLCDVSVSVEDGLGHCMRANEQGTTFSGLDSQQVTTQANSGFINLDEGLPEVPVYASQAATNSVAIGAPFGSPVFTALDSASSVTVITSVPVASSVATIAALQNLTNAATSDEPIASEVQAAEFKVQNVAPMVEPLAPTKVVAVPPAVSIDFSTFKPVGLAAGSTAVAALGIVQRSLSEQETEDEIDLVDAIDPDLFPIFEEEALELFPQLSGALRQWTARPTNSGARSEVLRGLHTIKGSARLAGAMRLGELAHRMETAIEQTPEDEASTAKIEPLTALLDGMQANFDRLRNQQVFADEQSLAAAPLVTPVESVPKTVGVPSTEAQASFSNAPALTALGPLRVVAANTTAVSMPTQRAASNQTVRVRSQLLDRLVNQAGEVMITRSRLEAELGQLRGSMGELTGNLDRLRAQLRDIEVQSESQMQSRMALAKESNAEFDPLEFDRFTRVQELTRMMAESVNDVATVQRNIQRTVEATEDDLITQARQTRELQRDLLRTRMVEFEGISERLYRVVRQASKDSGKQVKLEITGGSIEMDRGVLDRMTPAFEHLLRNCVAHGIEDAEARIKAGKDGSGQITISLHQEGNDVSVEFRDDGAGLNITRIRERAVSQGLLTNDSKMDDSDAADLIFTPGFTTASQVTELSGRGIGMDVVRSDVYALGGRIETSTSAGQGTSFKLVMPLTTAVTQVVMLRIGKLSVGVPATLVESVRRSTPKELQAAYNTGTYDVAGEALPFFWAGALLQHSSASDEPQTKTIPVIIFRSAAQRMVAHIDEVLGNQEVVVKNLGPQLSRLPGMAGMSVLASGAVVLIYNPVALAAVYGVQARAISADKAEAHVLEGTVTDVVSRDLSGDASPVVPLVPANPKSVSRPQIPLVLVVDDSITVRRVTQRLLQREGYRVALAADGLQALERLAEELPDVVLSDIEMPRMDGFDLVRNMKADPRLASLPIITITSRIAEKHREHAMSLGVDHYLGKPYSEEELLSLIRRYTSAEMPA